MPPRSCTGSSPRAKAQDAPERLMSRYSPPASTASGRHSIPRTGDLVTRPSSRIRPRSSCYTAEFMAAVLYDDARGGFYGSQDADITPDDDGSYFTWAIDEARAVLSDDEFSVLAEHYHLQGRGEMHTDPTRHVLYVDRDPDVVAAVLHRGVADVRRLLSSGREKLIAARGKRQMPYVDHACYANWNGLAITAFLDASVILGESRYRNLALRALDRFIEEGYRPQSGFAHRLGPDPSSGV